MPLEWLHVMSQSTATAACRIRTALRIFSSLPLPYTTLPLAVRSLGASARQRWPLASCRGGALLQLQEPTLPATCHWVRASASDAPAALRYLRVLAGVGRGEPLGLTTGQGPTRSSSSSSTEWV